ncbi:ADP-ribosylation factor GTPase activating protein [Trypanosoma conorhini]|uniref:ADP-ribosylation factor GTPase activating protein n=1 Tax=Trypanosoma conorhini TaxID=83891 RepID=A0A422Q4J6_9TRYP|nr:ADP-ribosylation factor GTPase activating protein [Trypanosoma conorhini]RNF24873.1 ADP-ribosylation factor GTPase activating protein [Trypanosoma conorhini]
MNPQARRVERNREEVRKLSLRDGNRFCVDCGMRGPLYVVSNFHVFVCSKCAALHRSQQHKVKGISMTEFTDAEVASLAVGGNDRAARVWFAKYQKQRPRPGNDRAISNFIVAAFEDLAYVDREELARLQSDVQLAVSGDGAPRRPSGSLGLPPSPEGGPRRSLPSQSPSQATDTAAASSPALAPTAPPATRGADAVPVDLFRPSAPPPPAPAAPTDDDMFADFLTAAAPPPQPPPAVAASASPSTAQAPLEDWFAAAPAPPHVNVAVFPGVTAGPPVPYPTPQPSPAAGYAPWPPNMLSQPGIPGQFGMQQGGYSLAAPSNVSQPAPQQVQYASSMSSAVAPNVVPCQAPLAQAQPPLSVGAATLTNWGGVNFFQEPPADPWRNPVPSEPTRAEPVKDTSAPHNDAFAFLDPFGSKC